MDLDKMKKEWKSEVFTQDVKDGVIKEMIANENKSAFARIKKKEKEALYIIPVCMVLFFCLSMPIIMHGGAGIFWVMLLIPITAGLWYWSYYLCGFLNRIDMARMSVTEVTGHILKYRTYLIRHTVVAAIFLPIYMSGWLYFYLSTSHAREETGITDFSQGSVIAFVAIYIGLLLLLFFAIIYFRFFKDVGNIRENLKRLEEFQAE
ncbi:hypothetical protein LJC72_12900 [Bacteroides sp. OttesenSCG-928-D19]|nr:hypothetical protein [Bacteroides sp. OttesenSCG-928-N06]MDL2306212.1 hypothetical protein [Bacteroides sp. OttesenSCG-928-D19]